MKPEINKVIRIAITGPESTGKSWLAEQLAGYYGTVWVPEYARSYLDSIGRPYVEDDLLRVAEGQVWGEEQAEKSANKLMFCDTELSVIKIWSEVKYGRCHPWIKEQLNTRQYPLYLLMNIDLPWEPDPQREHPDMREQLFRLYYKELSGRKVPFRIISGSGSQRFENALEALKNIM